MNRRNVWRLFTARFRFVVTATSLARAARYVRPRDGRSYAVKLTVSNGPGKAPSLLGWGLVPAKCWEQAAKLAVEWLSRHNTVPEGTVVDIATLRARRGERRRLQWLD